MYTPIQINRSTRYGNNYWEVYSPKLKRTVRLYSSLEYDHWLLLEVNPSIKSFCEQPLKINYTLEHKIHSSIFDAWILYTDLTEEFREIKYLFDLSKPKTQKQINIQRKWCLENGYKYSVQTDDIIRKNSILLENAKKIIPFLSNSLEKHPLNHKILRYVNCSSNPTGTSLKNITDILQENINSVFGCVINLVFQGKLKIDIESQRVTIHSKVWC
ncbi:TnsA endonuclease N-terminal domain-containing protein [Bacillus sonorensis]|uniref:TnsA endonuclease N-terminal domain-containing protein n=1 Tax=Bacillus sonorensis TaxID=119858 RepID=UPI002281C970|nr:TnsA endonuclease N-terminal domain-containing protein [Bacillus sonorensis]MCY8034296.1 TnsA endonuclease N-terminal domain-containing protein [Bacillus sonorensis]MCY8565351.1 TnsA endonuclease N-terminal domain-containing protein [Bacillus sonorensis]